MVDAPTIEQLALEVAEAFGTAFPETTMAQPQQAREAQTTPVAGATQTPACDHAISGLLRSNLADPQLCPTCQVYRHIKAIQDVQRQIFHRGGIFQSKNLPHGHKTLRQSWRKEKLRAIKTVTGLHMLMDCAQLSVSDKAEIASAVKRWEKQSPRLVLVPGVVEVGDPSEKEHEVARLMIELLTLVLDKEMTKEDKEAISIAKRQKEKARIDQAQQDQSPTSSTPAASSTSQVTATPTLPKSILKRKTPSSSPSPSPPHTRIRIAEFATISPSTLNYSNPSPFVKPPTNTAPTTQLHRLETMATSKRPQSAFWRAGAGYRPGAWASEGFENKANTSCYKLDWEGTEEMAKQEEMEAEEETAVLRGLRVVTGAWMGLWWVRMVARHIDLKELKGGAKEVIY
jgi:hypothetical protein